MDSIDHQICGFVERYIVREGMCPTLQEIADEIHMSLAGTWQRVRALVESEHLRKERNQGRTLRPGPKLKRR